MLERIAFFVYINKCIFLFINYNVSHVVEITRN